MKRRTRSYLVTHIAYKAKLPTKPTLDRPNTWREIATYIFFLFSVLYFGIGIARADVIELPGSPSKDFRTFQRQLVLHNVNRVVELIKTNNAEVRTVDKAYKEIQKPTLASSPKLGVKTTFQVLPLKGIAVYEVTYYSYKINQTYQAFNNSYEVSLGHGRWKVKRTPTFNIALDFSYSID